MPGMGRGQTAAPLWIPRARGTVVRRWAHHGPMATDPMATLRGPTAARLSHEHRTAACPCQRTRHARRSTVGGEVARRSWTSATASSLSCRAAMTRARRVDLQSSRLNCSAQQPRHSRRVQGYRDRLPARPSPQQAGSHRRPDRPHRCRALRLLVLPAGLLPLRRHRWSHLRQCEGSTVQLSWPQSGPG